MDHDYLCQKKNKEIRIRVCLAIDYSIICIHKKKRKKITFQRAYLKDFLFKNCTMI